jgi:hypothetical protein
MGSSVPFSRRCSAPQRLRWSARVPAGVEMRQLFFSSFYFARILVLMQLPMLALAQVLVLSPVFYLN